MTETIRVTLAERSYDIHVGSGLLSRSGALLKPLTHGVVPVVTDHLIAKMILGYRFDF